jgi:hypothetical protein
MLKFFQDFLDWKKILPLYHFPGGMPAFAVYTVKAAGLNRDKIDPQ